MPKVQVFFSTRSEKLAIEIESVLRDMRLPHNIRVEQLQIAPARRVADRLPPRSLLAVQLTLACTTKKEGWTPPIGSQITLGRVNYYQQFLDYQQVFFSLVNSCAVCRTLKHSAVRRGSARRIASPRRLFAASRQCALAFAPPPPPRTPSAG